MDVFPITPASVRPFWFIFIISIVLVLVLAALLVTSYAARHSRVELDHDSIRLVGDFWGRTIPVENLKTDQLRKLDLSVEREFGPKWRTFGTGLPGYASGWFRLHNGEKALLYLTDRSEVVYLPTTEGYALLLSVQHADRFIEALQ